MGPIAALAIGSFALATDVETPFEFVRNQILIPVHIGGRTCTFILDTGTYTSTIDLKLARSFGLDLGGRSMNAGAGGGTTFSRTTVIPKLDVAGISASDLKASAMDLSGVSRALGRPLDGVLGYGFLESRVVQIDYFYRRIRFLSEPPKAPEDSPASATFPMEFRTGSVLPVLGQCFVNGQQVALTLDTGSSLGLALFPQAVERLGLADVAARGIPVRAAGYLGAAELTKGWVRSLRLKTIDLGAIEVAYVRKGYSDHEPLERRGGNLGNAVLQDFRLTLDYLHRRVVLESAAP